MTMTHEERQTLLENVGLRPRSARTAEVSKTDPRYEQLECLTCGKLWPRIVFHGALHTFSCAVPRHDQ